MAVRGVDSGSATSGTLPRIAGTRRYSRQNLPTHAFDSPTEGLVQEIEPDLVERLVDADYHFNTRRNPTALSEDFSYTSFEGIAVNRFAKAPRRHHAESELAGSDRSQVKSDSILEKAFSLRENLFKISACFQRG